MLAQVFLVGAPARLDVEPLRREFPSLRCEIGVPPASAGVPCVDPGAFFQCRDTWLVDHDLERSIARARALGIYVGGSIEGALRLCTRLQRLIGRRNACSRSARFDELLARHRALHDLDKPLVRADWEHALDAWQWLLRLDGAAGLPLQAAVLFHDIERLRSEADRRREQHASDYDAYKDAHARGGAEMVREALADLLAEHELEEVTRLVAKHERPGCDRALSLVNDADALSFFSLNASGFLDYYGPAHTEKKIAWTLGRLSLAGRARLSHVGFRPDVRALVDAVLHSHPEEESRCPA